MSGPITDLDVLRREYAVEGWTWEIRRRTWGPDHGDIPVLVADEDGDVGWATDSDVGVAVWPPSWPDDACCCPPRIAITLACAHLGIPTPWAEGELVGRRRRIDSLPSRILKTMRHGQRYTAQDLVEMGLGGLHHIRTTLQRLCDSGHIVRDAPGRYRASEPAK